MRVLLLSMSLSLLAPAAFAAEGGCLLAGAADAPVKIEEFADFACPYCSKGAATIEKVAAAFPGKVKVVFRNLPLPFHGPVAVAAAKALSGICLQAPKLAGPFAEKLFANQAKLVKQGEPYLYAVAGELGADVSRLKADMGGAAVAAALALDQDDAARDGLTGTPSFYVGSELIVGSQPYDTFRKAVEKQLAK